MKIAVALIAVCLCVGVHTFEDEIADMIFKKYAMLKIFQDCYGKDTVANMFGEIRDAYYKCRQQPLSGIKNAEAPQQIPQKLKPAIMEAMNNKPFLEAMNNKPFMEAMNNPAFLEQIKLAQQAPPMQQRPVVSEQSYPVPIKFVAAYASSSFDRFEYPRPQQMRPSPYDQFYPYQQQMPYFYPYRQRRSEEVKDQLAVESAPVVADEVVQDPVVRAEDQQAAVAAEKDKAAMAAEKDKPAMAAEKDQPAQKPYPGSFVENLGFRLIASNYQYQMSNLTCVLKEVGFITENMEANFEGIHARIDKLPVEDAVKQDLCDGVEKCKKLVECVGVPSQIEDVPVMGQLVKPLSFFKCFKTRKVEACMKKDLREKLSQLLQTMDPNMLEMARRAVGSNMAGLGSMKPQNPLGDAERIFNMVYGFDLEPHSDELF